jgi:hypothetical protein
MRTTVPKCVLLIAFAVSGFCCLGQTEVYSLSVHTWWTVGSYPTQFGLEGYRKDSAGYYILADGTSVVGKITGKTKDYTSVTVGPIAFTVPLSPLQVALLAAAIIAALYILSAQIYSRFGRR